MTESSAPTHENAGRSTWGGPASLLGWLIAWVPAVVLGVVIHRHSVDLPLVDEWLMTYPVLLAHQGKLEPSLLWAQNNEHRVPLPRAILLGLSWLSDWNVQLEILFNYILAASQLALWIGVLRTSIPKRNHFALPIFAAAASCVLFSLVQWQNWTWGWQLTILLCSWSVLAAALATARFLRGKGGLAPIALSTAASALSFGAGVPALLILPIVLLLPDSRRNRRIRLRHSAILLLIGSLIAVAYVWNWHPASGQGASTSPLSAPIPVARFALACLGAPFASNQADTAILIGGLGILTLIAVLLGHSFLGRSSAVTNRGPISQDDVILIQPWLVPVAIGLVGACMTAVGRASGGISIALLSRYTTVSQLYWLGLLGLLASFLTGFGSRRHSQLGAWQRYLALSMATFIFGFTFWSYQAAFATGVERLATRANSAREARACVLRFEWSPNACLKLAYWNPDQLRGLARALRQANIGPFARTAADPPISSFEIANLRNAGRVQSIQRQTGGPDEVIVTGYAINPATDRPAPEVILAVGDQIVARGAPRPGPQMNLVAALAGADKLPQGSFALRFRAAPLPAGEVPLLAFARLEDGRLVKLDGESTIPQRK